MPSAKRSRSSRATRKTGARYTGSSSSRALAGRRSGAYPLSKSWAYQRPGWSTLWDPFPAKAYAIMRYSEVVTITATTGVATSYFFRANSIFDPNQTGIGHQPYGHDIYEQIYNHYGVTSSVITAQVTSPVNAIVGIQNCDDTVATTDFNTAREVKGTNVMVVSDQDTSQKIQQRYNEKALYPAMQSVNAPSALFGSNPNEQHFFRVFASPRDEQSGNATVRLLINITYVVKMWELKDLGQS